MLDISSTAADRKTFFMRLSKTWFDVAGVSLVVEAAVPVRSSDRLSSIEEAEPEEIKYTVPRVSSETRSKLRILSHTLDRMHGSWTDLGNGPLTEPSSPSLNLAKRKRALPTRTL